MHFHCFTDLSIGIKIHLFVGKKNFLLKSPSSKFKPKSNNQLSYICFNTQIVSILGNHMINKFF